MIYVDQLMQHGALGQYRGALAAQAERVGERNGHRWCHLFSDETDPAFPELHAFAARIGMKRLWFQGDHFDLTPKRRAAAVLAGAKEVGRREAVAIWRARRLRERPILFRGEMVRAILAGSKTCTRRPVNLFATDPGAADLLRVDGAVATFGNSIPDDPVPIDVRCPYGAPGDRLWVRETFTRGTFSAGRPWVRYRATDEKDIPTVLRWTPAIHMPRWLSRLDLEVTGVRVERIQQITEEGAQAEGLERREHFARLWDQIHGLGAFDSDPWVWVVSFRRLTP